MAERKVYPVLFREDEKGGYDIRIPDFDQYTEGESISNAIFMARDAIGMIGVYYEDKGIPIPEPFSAEFSLEDGEFQNLVDIDFAEYRARNENKLVKKNCTIPLYLEREAEKQGINFSRVLAEALAQRLAMPLA